MRTVKEGFGSIGVSVSDNECVAIVDMFKWYFEVQNKAETPKVFVDFLIERMNNDFLLYTEEV